MPSSDVSSLSAAVPVHSMANALRALAMDAVQAANSGHPGMPMGMADVATVLFSDFLKFDPTAPDWPTVIASSCRPAMARCCFTGFCI